MKDISFNAERFAEIDARPLLIGSHESLERGMCVMEAVSYVSGERWSDHPQCACPVIASFLRSWNDRLDDEHRQELKQYIPLLVGSRSTPAVERKRSWIMTDWVVRECAPLWLRRAGMVEKAAILEGMGPITGDDSYAPVRLALEAIRAETWPKRKEYREKIAAAVKEKLAGLEWPAAASDAVAAASDAAASDAVAAASDAAASDAVASDAVAAASDAVAAASDAAASDAVAAASDADAVAAAAASDAVAAAAAAAAAGYWPTYWNYREAIRKAIYDAIRPKFAETQDVSRASAHAMVCRMLNVTV